VVGVLEILGGGVRMAVAIRDSEEVMWSYAHQATVNERARKLRKRTCDMLLGWWKTGHDDAVLLAHFVLAAGWMSGHMQNCRCISACVRVTKYPVG
jgi:hypothetical protein